MEKVLMTKKNLTVQVSKKEVFSYEEKGYVKYSEVLERELGKLNKDKITKLCDEYKIEILQTDDVKSLREKLLKTLGA